MGHRNPIETEIKLRVPTLEGLQARLEALDFQLVAASQAESSTLWDRGTRLLDQGSALRLRRYAGKAWLTWKGPKIPDLLLKIRPEEETEVADAEAMESILRALGFEPVMQMEKRRAVLKGAELVACLDETPFGCFLELEGDVTAIKSAMTALSLGPELTEPKNYPTLYREHGLA